MASFPYAIIRNLDVYLPFLEKIYTVQTTVYRTVQYGTCTMWYIDVLLQYDCTTMDRNAGGRPAADRVICDVNCNR